MANEFFCQIRPAEIEGLLEASRDFGRMKMAEKASPALPPNESEFPMAK